MAKREAAVNAVQIGQNSAVINPYALAELVAGRKIPWKEIPDDLLDVLFRRCQYRCLPLLYRSRMGLS